MKQTQHQKHEPRHESKESSQNLGEELESFNTRLPKVNVWNCSTTNSTKKTDVAKQPSSSRCTPPTHRRSAQENGLNKQVVNIQQKSAISNKNSYYSTWIQDTIRNDNEYPNASNSTVSKMPSTQEQTVCITRLTLQTNNGSAVHRQSNDLGERSGRGTLLSLVDKESVAVGNDRSADDVRSRNGDENAITADRQDSSWGGIKIIEQEGKGSAVKQSPNCKERAVGLKENIDRACERADISSGMDNNETTAKSQHGIKLKNEPNDEIESSSSKSKSKSEYNRLDKDKSEINRQTRTGHDAKSKSGEKEGKSRRRGRRRGQNFGQRCERDGGRRPTEVSVNNEDKDSNSNYGGSIEHEKTNEGSCTAVERGVSRERMKNGMVNASGGASTKGGKKRNGTALPVHLRNPKRGRARVFRECRFCHTENHIRRSDCSKCKKALPIGKRRRDGQMNFKWKREEDVT